MRPGITQIHVRWACLVAEALDRLGAASSREIDPSSWINHFTGSKSPLLSQSQRRRIRRHLARQVHALCTAFSQGTQAWPSATLDPKRIACQNFRLLIIRDPVPLAAFLLFFLGRVKCHGGYGAAGCWAWTEIFRTPFCTSLAPLSLFHESMLCSDSPRPSILVHGSWFIRSSPYALPHDASLTVSRLTALFPAN